MEEDRVILARVRAPEEDDVRLLHFPVGAGAAACSKDRRQTDDARSVSRPIATIDVVGAKPTRANFCAMKFISFVAFEHEKMPNERVAPRSEPPRTRGGAVERLVPGGGAQLPVVADGGAR